MKNTLFKIFASALILTLVSCSGPPDGYNEIEGDWVYVHNRGIGSDKILTSLSADRDSFVVFQRRGYAKDKTNGFYKGQLIEGIHAPSFVLFSKSKREMYAKDKNRVYLLGGVLTDADPETFEIVKYVYGKDRSRVFCGTMMLKGADPDKFEIIKPSTMWGMTDDQEVIAEIFGAEYANGSTAVSNIGWSRDDKHYYFGHRRMDDADYNSFSVIDEFTAKDKNGVFNGYQRAEQN